MASLDEALELVKKDPPTVFVAIAVMAAQPPAEGLIVKLKGRSLLLPAWNGIEWGWYGDLAVRFAKSVDPRNDAGKRDIEVQLAKLIKPAPGESDTFLAAIKAFGSNVVDGGTAAKFYDVCNRVVIAANAAATAGETSGQIAVTAFKEAVAEAPATIIAALRRGLDNMTKVQSEAAKIMGEIFSRPIKAIVGGLLSGLGPVGIAVIVGGAYLYFRKRRGSRDE